MIKDDIHACFTAARGCITRMIFYCLDLNRPCASFCNPGGCTAVQRSHRMNAPWRPGSPHPNGQLLQDPECISVMCTAHRRMPAHGLSLPTERGPRPVCGTTHPAPCTLHPAQDTIAAGHAIAGDRGCAGRPHRHVADALGHGVNPGSCFTIKELM